MIIKEAIAKLPPRIPVKILFEDEARFGRLSDHRRCWAPMWERPVVGRQVIREYVYTIAAVCPADGNIVSLIMPWMDAEIMSVFLAHAGMELKNSHCLIFMDRAMWHVAKDVRLPKNITLLFLPPYSPELNPVEHIWDHLRENYFGNRMFESLDKVEDVLCSGLQDLSKDNKLVSSLTYFNWLKTINLISN
jgi:transposase